MPHSPLQLAGCRLAGCRVHLAEAGKAAEPRLLSVKSTGCLPGLAAGMDPLTEMHPWGPKRGGKARLAFCIVYSFPSLSLWHCHTSLVLVAPSMNSLISPSPHPFLLSTPNSLFLSYIFWYLPIPSLKASVFPLLGPLLVFWPLPSTYSHINTYK